MSISRRTRDCGVPGSLGYIYPVGYCLLAKTTSHGHVLSRGGKEGGEGEKPCKSTYGTSDRQAEAAMRPIPRVFEARVACLGKCPLERGMKEFSGLMEGILDLHLGDFRMCQRCP